MQVARGSLDGEKASVERKVTMDEARMRRARAMDYYRLRLDGWNDSQIGSYFNRSRVHVNRWINALSDGVKAKVARERLLSIQIEAEVKRRGASPCGV